MNNYKLNLMSYSDIIYKTNLSNYKLYACLDLILNDYDLDYFKDNILAINIYDDSTLELFLLEYYSNINDYKYVYLESYVYDNNLNKVKIKLLKPKFC